MCRASHRSRNKGPIVASVSERPLNGHSKLVMRSADGRPTTVATPSDRVVASAQPTTTSGLGPETTKDHHVRPLLRDDRIQGRRLDAGDDLPLDLEALLRELAAQGLERALSGRELALDPPQRRIGQAHLCGLRQAQGHAHGRRIRREHAAQREPLLRVRADGIREERAREHGPRQHTRGEGVDHRAGSAVCRRPFPASSRCGTLAGVTESFVFNPFVPGFDEIWRPPTTSCAPTPRCMTGRSPTPT